MGKERPREKSLVTLTKRRWIEKSDGDNVVRFLNGAVVVHERHIPMICELPPDLFDCEFRVTGRVCLRERNGVRILAATRYLHLEDDPGEIVGFGASGSKLDLRRKRHAV